MAYCTFNEGLGKVCVSVLMMIPLHRLHWLRNEFYPVIKEALEIRGEIDPEGPHRSGAADGR